MSPIPDDRCRREKVNDKKVLPAAVASPPPCETENLVGLVAYRKPEETWRECVFRNASVYGLQYECLRGFDDLLASGMDEHGAAWCAMYDWDLGLEVVPQGASADATPQAKKGL